MALAIYSYLIKGLQNKEELLKQKLMVGYKGIIFYTFTAFQYMVTIKGLDILFVINSAYNIIELKYKFYWVKLLWINQQNKILEYFKKYIYYNYNGVI